VARYLSPGGQQFRGDRGAADPRVTAALAAYLAGEGSEQQALAALAGARLLVPVVATATEAKDATEAKEAKDATETADSEMAMPTLIGHDGRHAILAFTGTGTLARWREEARPVPAESSRVWRAAVAEGCAVVIDVAGPVPLAVEGARLAALAAGRPVPPPHEDPDIRAAVGQVLSRQPGVQGFTLAPGRQADLTVTLYPTTSDWQPAARAVAAALADRLRRGIEFTVSTATIGS